MGRASCSGIRRIAVASFNRESAGMYTNLGDGAQAPLQGRKVNAAICLRALYDGTNATWFQLWGSRARINKLHDKLVELSQQEATCLPPFMLAMLSCV